MMAPSSLLASLMLMTYFTPSCTGQASCVNRCGEAFFRGNLCHCDYNCIVHKECCSDYESLCTTGTSCRGRCGESFKRGKQCHCDPECSQYKQCCPDYDGHCDREAKNHTPSETSTDATVSGDQGSVLNPETNDSLGAPKPNPADSELTIDSTTFPLSSEQDTSGTPSTEIEVTMASEDMDALSQETATPSSNGDVTTNLSSNLQDQVTVSTADEPSNPEANSAFDEDLTDGKNPNVNLSSEGGEGSSSADPTGQIAEGIEEATPTPHSGEENFSLTENSTDLQSSSERSTEGTSANEPEPRDPMSGALPESATPSGERPSPTPSGERPSPTPSGERPSPTPSGERPSPTPSGERPSPTPSGERPSPTPSGERPSPAPKLPTTPASSGPNAALETESIPSSSSTDTPSTESPPANMDSQTGHVPNEAAGDEVTSSTQLESITPWPAADQPDPPAAELQDEAKPKVPDSGNPAASNKNPSKSETPMRDTESPKMDTAPSFLADESDDTDLCNGRPIGGLTTLRNGTIVVFRGHYFWVLDDNRIPGPARSIREGWGLPSPIDTVFTRCNCHGKTYFFKGDRFWRFENDVMDPGYPKTISSGFSGLAGRISAALTIPAYGQRRESVFFFKGGGLAQRYTFKYGTSPTCGKATKYTSVTVRNRQAREAASTEDGLGGEFKITWRGFPTHVTSAVSLPAPRNPDGYNYYVFSRTKYYNIKIDGDQLGLASPAPLQSQNSVKNWLNCL